MIRVVLAGATGLAGSELARGIAWTDDISLVAAVISTMRRTEEDWDAVLPVR